MKNRDSSHYQRIWRWHFYAGLFVAPFLILLSLTGILYLYKPQLDNLLYPELMKVTPATQTLSADQLLAKATIAMPDASLRKYLPPAATDASAQLVAEACARDARRGCSRSQYAPGRGVGRGVRAVRTR